MIIYILVLDNLYKGVVDMRVSIFILLLFVTMSAEKVVHAECTYDFGTGIIWRSENDVRIKNIFGFKKAPTAGSDVFVVPYGSDIFQVFKLKVLNAKKEKMLGQYSVEVELSDVPFDLVKEVKSPNPRVPEFLSNVVVILSAGDSRPSIARVDSADMPTNVNVKTVNAAISMSAGGKPNILISKFQCSNRNRALRVDDEMICEEYWQKVDSQWKRCNFLQPM